MMKMMLMMMKKPIVLVACVVLVSSLAVLASDSKLAVSHLFFSSEANLGFIFFVTIFLNILYGFVLNFLYNMSVSFLGFPGSSAPTECCFEFFPRRLRTNNVVSYQYTDDRCAKKAVL